MMRVSLLSRSDVEGGAARATYRIHQALRGASVDSTLIVRRKRSEDPTVMELRSGIANRIAPPLERLLLNAQWGSDTTFRSTNLVGTKWHPYVDADVVHLNWIGAGAISVGDVARLAAPVVITLHDMWPFCGAEHYAPDDLNQRWVAGYSRSNRSPFSRGIDLDRIAWQRKRRLWRPMSVVAPSRWIADCARRSSLMGDWPVKVIPYPLDMKVFSPGDKLKARHDLGLPLEGRFILFGAIGGARDPRKGFELLAAALDQVSGEGVTGIVFGQGVPEQEPRFRMPIRWMGAIEDDSLLASLYRAADVMVVPSIQEALGQTATEAQACGTPVVAFDHTGVADAVKHRETGFLADPYSVDSLTAGIEWCIEHVERNTRLGRTARTRAEALWSPATVSAQYVDVYEAASRG